MSRIADVPSDRIRIAPLRTLNLSVWSYATPLYCAGIGWAIRITRSKRPDSQTPQRTESAHMYPWHLCSTGQGLDCCREASIPGLSIFLCVQVQGSSSQYIGAACCGGRVPLCWIPQLSCFPSSPDTRGARVTHLGLHTGTLFPSLHH